MKIKTISLFAFLVSSFLFTQNIAFAQVENFSNFTTETNTLQNGRSNLATVIYKNYLYVIGGESGGTPYKTVEISKITNNVLSSFIYGKDLPVGISGAKAFVFQDKLFLLGGKNRSEIIHSNISQIDGSLST